jgi:hypothetical protein
MNIAIPFYTRDNFVKITALLPNSDWPETYELWLSKTEKGEQGVKMSGNVPVRVDVEPAAFEAWCKSHQQPVIREMIGAFCAFTLGMNLRNAANN